ADIPPPAYVREPLRLNTSAGPVTSARTVQRPTPPPAPADIPPPAYTREPLRLNMPGTSARTAPATQPPPAAQPPNRGASTGAAPPTLYPPGERPLPPPQAVPVLTPVGPATPQAVQGAPAGSAQPNRPAGSQAPAANAPQGPPSATNPSQPAGRAPASGPQAPSRAIATDGVAGTAASAQQPGTSAQGANATPQASGQNVRPGSTATSPQNAGSGFTAPGMPVSPQATGQNAGATAPGTVGPTQVFGQNARPGSPAVPPQASGQNTGTGSTAVPPQNARPGSTAVPPQASGQNAGSGSPAPGTSAPTAPPQAAGQNARPGSTAPVPPAAQPPQAAGARQGTPALWPPSPGQQAREASGATLPAAPAPPRGEPSFIIFSNPAANPGANRPRTTPETASSVPGASNAPGAEVPDWTLPQARAALRESTRDRDRLVDVALRFGRRTFDYVAAFAVVRGAAGGWDSRGEGLDANALSQVSIPLDASSVFRTVAVTRGSYAGPLPPDALTRHYLELFGRQSPRTVFLYPVEVKGRLVAILYGDCGQKPMSQRRLSDYILFCQDLPAAFQELILFRKQRVAELRTPDEDFTIDVDVPGFPAASQP
ncbi:hypothetical protein D7V97_42785, partial [Corallococcus sp. CA053C]